jgi:glycosyltransferase involved in cell wall biosynthesis
MLQLLTFTNLYPNSEQPRHGLFVEQRLRHLLATGRVRSRVVAPVPWFPFDGRIFGGYGEFSRIPLRELRGGIEVAHPRHVVLPKVGMSAAPLLMRLGVERTIRRIVAGGYDFQAIDAHYFYPDGVAATMIGLRLGRPVVVTARGSDVNVIPANAAARRQIVWSARRCAEVVTVSRALKDRLVELGVAPERITVLRNGVDLERFRPMAREEARRRTQIEGATLLTVGHLNEAKGHGIAIDALALLPDVRLVVVGEGPRGESLRRRARELGVAERVRFVGAVAPDELPSYYSAADALVLASRNEGMANVLLESLACGTPVIGTAVGGSPEVVCRPEAGVLMQRRDARALAAAWHELLARGPDRAATRRFAEGFGWEATTRGQLEIFSRVAADCASERSA